MPLILYPLPLFRRLNQFDIFFQELIDKYAERGSARLGTGGEIVEYVGIEMHRRNELRTRLVELGQRVAVEKSYSSFIT